MNYSFVFPGQGSQEVGMGRSLYDEYDSARAVFDSADKALGFRLSEFIFEGPEEKLQETEFTQPAILTTSIAVYSVLAEITGRTILKPSFMAGHSLGEYTALVASGALSLEDGVKLVHLRGRLMQEAVPIGEGTMAAILGLNAEEIDRVCKQVSGVKGCQAANYNSPGQTVISGHVEAVSDAVELSKEMGARKAVLLKVSAPFHSSLMFPVAEKLEKAASECDWKKPYVPVVVNYSGKPVTEISDIISALKEQTYNPVLWSASVDYMVNAGSTTFFELGPGKVLSGLIRKCVKGTAVMAGQDKESLARIKEKIDREGS